MSTSADLVTYSVTAAEIASKKAEFAGLSCDTPKGYEEVRLAIASVRDARVAVEKRRVELKADALAYGRLVDSRAKELTSLLLEIEEPLKAKKQAVDDEKARIKAEAEAEKLRALQAIAAANLARQEEEARLAREAEEARLAEERAAIEVERAKLAEEKAALEAAARAERERIEAEQVAAKKAEEERLEVERAKLAIEEERQRAERAAIEAERRAEEAKLAEASRVEEERLAAEREKLAAERRAEEERQQAAREAIEADRKAVAAAREAQERAEEEREAKARAEKEAAEKIEREKVEAERREAERVRLMPDLDKIAAYAAAIRALPEPDLIDLVLAEKMRTATDRLGEAADYLDEVVAGWQAVAS